MRPAPLRDLDADTGARRRTSVLTWLLFGGIACAASALATTETPAASASEIERTTGATAANASVQALAAPKAAANRLLDIAVAGDTLVAVGQQGVVLVSSDARQWQQASVPTGVMLTRARFTDATQGWALGYDATVLQTRDGGRTWTLQHQDPQGRALYDLLFLDAQHGLAVGAYGTLLETRDGGATWQAREDVLSGLGMHLNALRRLGDGSLFVVGERGLMARSTDAGASWALLDSPYVGSLFGALAQGEAGVLVFGMRGHVFVSADPSRTPTLDPATWDAYTRESVTDPETLAARGWRRIESPVAESLFGAVALDDGGAVLVGVNGTCLRLDAANRTLHALTVPVSETLSGLVAHDHRLIAVGRRGIADLGATP